ncbi:FAD-binding domain-containing protein [Fusarium mundagurra]|uniref:FAD-binding domain-containing protein n=1 Tax=Fusarium mundagurra TaxID=1567541 RepID=A0A8H6DPJ6_9HYPO|nr:FAD-binding domain-containing protein [Fusarium mundagurra]
MGSNQLPVDQLRASLTTSDVLVPGDDGYQRSLHRWSEAAEKPAAYVVQVTNAHDVSKALLFAQEHRLDVAVVGGGHSTSGSSSTDGGLVVDLTKMRNVTVDYANKTITAEGGTIWEDVDYAAAKYGLATVGGTVNHTGVGGLTLGGGYGWLTGKHGLTIDNLLAAEVVLADGRIMQTSESENPDLFWALRGAGQSFGVATSFTFRGYKQENSVYGGLLVFKPDALEKVVEFANWLVQSTEGESGMVVGFGAPAPARKVSVLTIIYNGDQAKAREYFAPLFALEPVADLTREMPYRDVNAMLNTVSTHGDRKTQKGSAFSVPLSTSLARTILTDYTKFINDVPDAVKSIVLMEFFSQRQVNKVSQTAMSFANRGEHYNILFGTRWVGDKNDKICRDWTRTMGQKVNEELKKDLKGDGVGQYGNYDGVATSLAQEIFGVNYNRVLALKKQYDPKNVFNKGAGKFSL